MTEKNKNESLAEYIQFLKDCLKCEKKCANCTDNKDRVNEVRDDFYSFRKSQIELNTTCKDKIKVIDTMPAMKRDLYITMGTATVVGILLAFLLSANAKTSDKIESIQKDVTTASQHIENTKNDITDQKERDRKITIMQSDIGYLKEKADKRDEKIDIILQRLPKQ